MVRKAYKLNRPGLWLFLFLINLIILAMPLSGIYLFRVYENELVRQTESELIVQAAVLGATFKKETLALAGPNYGLRLGLTSKKFESPFIFLPPTLNMAEDDILPRGYHFSPSPYEMEISAALAAQSLTSIINEASRTTLSKAYILDYHGLVVAGSEGVGLSLAENIEVAEALRGHYKSVMRQKPGKNFSSLASPSRNADFWVFVAVPIFNGERLVGVVALSRTPRPILKALYEERYNLALAGFAVLTLMAILSIASSILIVSPIKRLSREALLVAEGNQPYLSPKAAMHDSPLVVREVADLGEAVFTMAERLRHKSDYLKAFAAGVSHEFKTPLTSLKGALELLGEHGHTMEPATKARFENNIRKDLERLEKLVFRLLGLARAEALEVNFSEKTDMAEVLRSLQQKFFSDTFKMETDCPSPCFWAGPLEVIDTVLLNLIENARLAEASLVTVTVECQGSAVSSITIHDNGPGFDAETAGKIFDPFFTTRKQHGGTGLGLSLCQTLLTPYRARLECQNSEKGATFKVFL